MPQVQNADPIWAPQSSRLGLFRSRYRDCFLGSTQFESLPSGFRFWRLDEEIAAGGCSFDGVYLLLRPHAPPPVRKYCFFAHHQNFGRSRRCLPRQELRKGGQMVQRLPSEWRPIKREKIEW